MSRYFLLPCLLAGILVPPSKAGTTLSQAWALLPADGLDYITTGSTERGIAYNPITGHVLLVTRAGGNRVIVLNAADGAVLHEMDTTGVAGGNGNAFNMVGVASDGVVYVCNLVVASTAVPLSEGAKFKIYRWDSEAAGVPPGLAFNSDPSGLNDLEGSNFPNRWGDTLAVRGSGLDTQIIAGSGSTGTAACVFITPDGINFIPHFLNNTPLESGGSKGIAFGAGNTFYSKANGGAKRIRRSSFDTVNLTSAMLNDFTVAPSTGIQIIPFGLDLAAHQWGTFETGSAGAENVKLFDISDVNAAPILLDQKTLPTDNANANAVGSAAIGGGKLFICDTNNGLVAYNITVTPDIVPPAVAASPAGRTVYARGQTTFSVTVTGTPPLTYQWLKDDAVIDGATAPDYTINPVTAASAGVYKCRVSNAAPTPAESTAATMTVIPSVDTAALTECWHLAPGSRPYLTTGETERGMDYHPGNNRIYVASRTPKVLKVLSGTDGSDLGSLLTTDLTGGNAGFELNMVGVAADGMIYACNLSNITTGEDFKIYQWPNDAPDTVPEVRYTGNPLGTRIGDTIDVRGSGAETQIVCGARSSNQLAIFTKAGTDFVSTTITVAEAPANGFGLGVAFGSGNTVWGKTSGGSLYLVSFDLAAGAGSVLATYGEAVIPGNVSAIGVDSASGLLAGIQLDNSDNVRLYNLPVPFPDPAPATLELLDQEFLATDNANGNGTGSVAAGGGKVFALDTNNGLVCYTAVKPAAGVPPDITNVTQSGGNLVFRLKGTIGKTYLIEKSTELSPASWTPDGTVTQNAAEETVTRPIAPGIPRTFFRAREQ